MPGSNAKIIIIMPDPYFRNLFTAQLRQHGFEVTEAAQFSDILKTVKKEKPDLVIADEWDGAEIDLLVALKKDRALSRIPVVIFSAQDYHSEHIQIAKQLGAADVLSKDINLKQFAERIKSALK